MALDGNAARNGIDHDAARSGPARGARIQLQDLSKFYGDVGASRDLNLDIQPGEFLTLLGPSGSGKTTALMMIAGFVIPSAGDILIGGRSIVQVPVHKRNIGMVFQNYALFPHLSVARNVAFPLEMRNTPKPEIQKLVKAALELVRLGEFGDRRPKQLSGGQQQRVALARALVFNPAVLLLDEPLGALDAKLREEMKIEIKQLHKSIGATILFVTHDQEEALTLSDRIAVFDGGSIVQVGTPDQLYHQPETRFVADFIGETNLIAGKVASVSGQTCRLELAGGHVVTGNLRDGFPTPENWATYTLRLEKVSVGDAAENCTNRLAGKVQEFLFIGDSTKYVINLGPGWDIKVKLPETGKPRHDVGTEIQVGWNESDMLLVEVDVPPTDIRN
jgi:spermidine/putrescine ABC transporter ATP-binding subunit